MLRWRAQEANARKAVNGGSGGGVIRLPLVETFPLACGADAHRLEDRSFAGKIVLLPDAT